VSAFENGRAGQDRPKWARSGRGFDRREG